MLSRECKVLLVEDNPVNASLVRHMLKDTDGASFVVTHVESLVKALDRLAKDKFDIGLVDLSLPDSEGLETFLAVQRHAPGLPVVVLSGCDDEALAMAAVERGAQDYLVKGKLRAADLIRAVQYGIIRGRKASEDPAPRRTAEVVAFLGGKGGVGTTTLACHASHCLKRQEGEDTLLFGLDSRSAAASLYMKVESEYTLSDAAGNLHRLDAALWRGLVSTTAEGVDVLLPPDPAQLAEPLTGERVRHVLRFARSLYRWIVVDLGTVNPVSLAILEEVKDLYLVTSYDFPALWDTNRTLKLLLKLGLAQAQIRLVANRSKKRGSLSPSELTKALGFPIHAVVGDSSEEVEQSFLDKRFVDPNSHLSMDTARMVGKLPGVETPDPQPLPGWKRLFGLDFA
jgi:pilus assembly protein CpaE